MVSYLVSVLGLVAGFLLIIAYIPQAFKTIKTKSTKDISLLFTIFIFIGDSLWLIYGIILNSIPLIITNSALGMLIFPILLIKIKNDLEKMKK